MDYSLFNGLMVITDCLMVTRGFNGRVDYFMIQNKMHSWNSNKLVTFASTILYSPVSFCHRITFQKHTATY